MTVDRRSYLKTFGAAAAAGSLWVVGRSVPRQEPPVDSEGTPPAPNPPPRTTDNTPPTPEDADPEVFDRFDTVHDVKEAGADPTGTNVDDDLLEDLAGDDTLLWFPSGRYRVNHLRFVGLTNLGLVGDDATLVLGDPGRTLYLGFMQVADLLMEGFDIDATAANTAAWLHCDCIGGRNVIRDYTVRGLGDVDERTNGFTILVEGAETSLLVERADLSDGAKNGAATFVFPQQSFSDPSRDAGSLEFRDCRMEGWGKEGLYASAHSGPIRIVGGEYANNAIVQLRVGGGNAPTNAVIDGVSVRIDDIPGYIPPHNRLFRGIWLKEGDLATIQNCEVVVGPDIDDPVQAGIIVNDQFGRATIRNCRLEMDVPSPAIRIEPPIEDFEQHVDNMPGLSRAPQDWTVTCRDLEIVGAGASGPAVTVHGRSGCRFEDVTIAQRQPKADGIYAMNAGGCVVAGGSVSVPRYPGVVASTGPVDGSCQLKLQGVQTFEGRSVQDIGEPLAELREGALPSTPDGDHLDEEFCLPDALVGNLVEGEQEALALTGVNGGILYGKVVPYKV